MLETDYLVVGAGALGMAFTDQLLTETDATVTIVDKHSRPGGHWNDAYSFVRLHQPSAFYGASSRVLGSNRIESSGVNRGLYEQASGAEVQAYFERLMQDTFLSSGRVRYFPMSEYEGQGRFTSLISGETTTVTVNRRVVDATYFETRVPSTTPPRFKIAEGIKVVTPNALPGEAPGYQRFTIIGGGKTGMDVAVWLLSNGIDAGAIRWVMPRDSWLINRETVQPGDEFYRQFLEARLAQMDCCAQAESVDHLFDLLEQSRLLLRLDPAVKPRMYHVATISPAEVELLREIKEIIRLGRVRAIEPDRMLLEQGSEPVRNNELFIDCSASAITRKPVRQIFEDGLITLQTVRAGLFCLSAAVIAHIEAGYANDADKNRLCRPIPTPDLDTDWLRVTYQDNEAQTHWSKDQSLRRWLDGHRLTGANLRSPDIARNKTVVGIRGHIRARMPEAQANLASLRQSLS